MGEKEASRRGKEGAFFQLPMILFWFLQGVFMPAVTIVGWSWLSIKNHEEPYSSLGSTIQFVGFVLMATSMMRIYKHKRTSKENKLITTDVFAITRHPMYHGMFIVNLQTFFVSDLTSPLFWVSWIIFTFLIFTAGWYQEKETLARWGDEAEEYYKNTPRFFFQWIWFRRPQIP